MSSGFLGFFAHLGCLEALEESGLAPAGISGSSAGALAGAIWASASNMSNLKKRLFNLTTADFWDPAPGPGLLQGNRFRNLVAQICPVARIEECQVPLTISAFDLGSLATHSLREGLISEVVYASCCVPVLFQPIRIGKFLYLDGGIGDQPGLAGIPAHSRVLYHHLQSAWPCLKKDRAIVRILKNRPNTVAMMVNNIEAVGPATMKRGKQAFHQTRAAILKALGQPIAERQILI